MEKFYNLIEDRYSYPIAATLVDDRYLYFVTCYNNILYKLDLETDEYEEILMPVGNKKAEAFWHIVYYNGKLLFVPYQEEFFLEYNIADGGFNILFEELALEKPLFRDCAVDGNRLILLGMASQQLVVIDLKSKEVINKISLAKYVERPGISLFWMKLSGKYAYIFGRIGKAVLKVNYMDGKINLLKTVHEILYGEYFDNSVIYIPNPEYILQICCLDLKTGKVKHLCNAEEIQVKGVAHARYWRPKQYGQELFFLPYEAQDLIIYHMDSASLEKVEMTVGLSKSYQPNFEKAVGSIMSFGDGFIVIPFAGSGILKLNSSKEIEKTYTFKISDNILEKHILGREDNIEIREGVVDLEEFIEYVKKNG